MNETPFSLPPAELLQKQSDRLAGMRARLLRAARIAARRRILDLGCGYGSVTPELVRRGGGTVVALDRRWDALAQCPESFTGAIRVCGDAARLPLADATFDLVYGQLVLMWTDASVVIDEIRRVLAPGGVFIAVEPDYGGLIEMPETVRTQPLWLDGLRRAGADPLIGRKVPALLTAHGFDVRVQLMPELNPIGDDARELLHGLPLSEQQQDELRRIEVGCRHNTPWARLVHLPLFLLTATRPG